MTMMTNSRLQEALNLRNHFLSQGIALTEATRQTALHMRVSRATVSTYLGRAAVNGLVPESVEAPGLIEDRAEGFIPPGKATTLYDGEGNVRLRWVRDPEENDEVLEDMIAGLSSQIEPVAPAPFKQLKVNADIMAIYPVGDHHYGMLSWHEETGHNYDLKIAEARLFGAVDHLITRAPRCKQALVLFLGDFMHYDSYVPETPKNRNKLDADGRFPNMVQFAIRGMRVTINKALAHHENVHVVVEPGNHDPSCSIILMNLIAVLYEKEPRVTVDVLPRRFHYFEFGKCLIGTHHGDTVRKMEALGPIMAHDQAEAWGRTKYRYWWTGHVHTDRLKDLPGCRVESVRVLAAPDAWAHEQGYRPMMDMKCAVLHKDFGEMARYTVNPDMLV